MPTQARGRNLQAREQLVHVPAEPALDASALRDEVLAVIYEQAQLARGTVQVGDG